MEHFSTSAWLRSSDQLSNPSRRKARGGLTAGIAALLMVPAGAQTVLSGLRNEVVFTEYSALSSVAELVRRSFSPLRSLRLAQEAERTGRTLHGQSIDLAKERYSIYVPAHAHSPAGTYSLLVFIPPWSRAEVPRQWISALDQHDMILVTAANSGNDAPTTDRREPLALLAALNTMAQYPVDAQHVFIGGFSGGARVALRLALAYPDVFHGVLLNAGSDPIGTADVPLPPADLFRRFQESTRLVYVTGERDAVPLADDMDSRRSLKKWCVFDVVTQSEPRKEHELADVSAFSRSLDALLGRGEMPPAGLPECRARIDQELSTQLQQIESLFARGESDNAKQLLAKIDARYGGLAAPRSVELAAR
jgi:pimeloyl-ACP methyl ester carboxylesterase